MSDKPRLLVVTGMSGAGKTSALKVLEDLGYEAVDNLPLGLLPRLAGGDEPPRRPIAVGLDSRTRGFHADTLLTALDTLRGVGVMDAQLLFLDCDDDILHNRYTATRRVHPLAADRPVADGIALERELMAPARARADSVIDTSKLKLPELRAMLIAAWGLRADNSLNVMVTSFSYRQGLPREADLVFDMRFLANPFYEPELREQSGEDAGVAAYIERDPAFAPFFERLGLMLRDLLPAYARAGKRYLTIAIGCTGGRHRSVHTAKKLAETLENGPWRVALRHRDIHLGHE